MVHQHILTCKFHRHVDLHWIILIIGLCGIGPVIYAGHIPPGCSACPSDAEISAYNMSAEQTLEYEDSLITLYRSGHVLTWCQAHCACIHVDSSSYLLTIPNALKQQEIERFNSTDISQEAWISANRRSGGWYWVNESFENCSQQECSALDIVQGEYGTGRNDGIGPPVLRAQKITEKTISGLCENGGIPSTDLTWYEKQQWCMSQSSLLATWEGLLSHTAPNLLFIGLQYRPWQWTQNGDTFPVLFTNWIPGDRQHAGVADCLSMELNSTSQGEWVELDCAAALHHFICEYPEPSTEGTTTDILKYWLPPVLIVVVAAIIIPITVVKCKQKQKNMEPSNKLKRGTGDKQGETVPEVAAYGVTTLHNSPNKAALRNASMSGHYADVEMKPAIKEKSSMKSANPVSSPLQPQPSEYALAGPLGNPPVYSAVHKKTTEDNETVLVDNPHYGRLSGIQDDPIGTSNLHTRNKLPPIISTSTQSGMKQNQGFPSQPSIGKNNKPDKAPKPKHG